MTKGSYDGRNAKLTQSLIEELSEQFEETDGMQQVQISRMVMEDCPKGKPIYGYVLKTPGEFPAIEKNIVKKFDFNKLIARSSFAS